MRNNVIWLLLLIVGAGTAFGLYLMLSESPPNQNTAPVTAPPPPIEPKSKVSLETQIEELAKAGIHLSAEATISDILLSFKRSEYEGDPYQALLFVYGIEIEQEPWGRNFTNQLWNLDMECINDDGSYVTIVKGLVRITGQPEILHSVSDEVDLSDPTARLTYKIGSIERDLSLPINNDWADPAAVDQILRDIMQTVDDGRRFFAMDNGQASVFFFGTESQALAVNQLAGRDLLMDLYPL